MDKELIQFSINTKQAAQQLMARKAAVRAARIERLSKLSAQALADYDRRLAKAGQALGAALFGAESLPAGEISEPGVSYEDPRTHRPYKIQRNLAVEMGQFTLVSIAVGGNTTAYSLSSDVDHLGTCSLVGLHYGTRSLENVAQHEDAVETFQTLYVTTGLPLPDSLPELD